MLYPDIEPYASNMIDMETLSRGKRHTIYIEQCGNPNGIPVVFLHGGPGSGCRPLHRCYFDPDVYHIILFDQRGCGRSLPHGELENNTTQYLIADMEVIRQRLSISRWLIFGGSWGATLGLVYAQRHPDKVLAMILRGVFLARKQDIDWVYKQDGASRLFPDAWEKLINCLPDHDESTLLNSYYQKLTKSDVTEQRQAATTLQQWEGKLVSLYDAYGEKIKQDTFITRDPVAQGRIQLHYIINGCFITECPILDNINSIKTIPATIIHGRYDLVCPVDQAWALCKQWQSAQLTIVPTAGHLASDPAVSEALVLATRNMALQLA